MSNGSGAIGMGVDHAAPFAAAAGHAGFGQVPTATYYPPAQVIEMGRDQSLWGIRRLGSTTGFTAVRQLLLPDGGADELKFEIGGDLSVFSKCHAIITSVR
ncbi:unnamed protein product, partial [Sphagnum balticum]